MEKRIDAWVDKKMVVSIALGILLAAWMLWFGGFVMRALGIGHSGMGYGMKNDMRGMHNKMRDQDAVMYHDPAGTFMEGSEIPTDIDTSAM